MIFIADGLGSVYQDSARFNLLVANHFYCGRQTIGVPGLSSVMNHIFLIAGGKRSVYRDSILSWMIFLLREANDWCTGTHEWIIYFLCDWFLLREDDNRCTGTRFNFLVWWSVYCGRQTISVPGLNFFIRIQPRIVFIEGSWGHVTKKGCQKAIINFTRKHR